jgi:hypothetical protein
MPDVRCRWCDNPFDDDFSLCKACVGLSEPYVMASSLNRWLLNPPAELHEDALDLARDLARESRGSWEERVRFVQDGLTRELSETLARSGLSREFVQIACAARKEALQALSFGKTLDTWSAENGIAANDLVHLAAGGLPSAVPPPTPDPDGIFPLWDADAIADAWRIVTWNAATATALADARGLARPDVVDLVGEFEPEPLAGSYREIERLVGARMPEDYEPRAAALRRSLEKRRLLPEQIAADIESDLVKTCGFGLVDLRAFDDAVHERFRDFGKTPMFPQFVDIGGRPCCYGLGVERKDKLRETYLRHGGKPETWDQVTKALLAPVETPQSLSWEAADRFRHAVLYEVGDFYLVAIASTVNVHGAFKQAVLTGHWLERFGGPVGASSPALSDAGNRMATFLSFIVAEWFADAGFKVPTEGGVVRAEIKKIAKLGSKPLKISGPDGKDLGDLDVLAVDETTHVVHIVEIKYWKPGFSNETALKGASKLDEDLRRRIKARHKWVEDNVAAVVAFAGAAPGNYTVKTTLASSRPMLVADPEFTVTHLTVLERELAGRGKAIAPA